MKLLSLKVKGFSTAFPGVVELPFRDIPSGLVAVVGSNGQGKTTLLEAVAGGLYQRLPSRNDRRPVDLAVTRDASIDLEYELGPMAFRSRLNMDAQTRKTDGVLEAILPDGTTAKLTDGKISTYKTAIDARFPSFELFLNSAFAAQGRGDAFTSALPSERKDLFVEFLGLERYLTMAKRAGEYRELCADSELRLTAKIEALELETAPGQFEALDETAHALEITEREARDRRAELVSEIQTLEAREALSADVHAAYHAAQLQVTTLGRELTARRADQHALTTTRATFDRQAAHERETLSAVYTESSADLQKRIDGNAHLQAQRAEIGAAVEAIAHADALLTVEREALHEQQQHRDQLAGDLAKAEKDVSTYAQPKRELELAVRDSALLKTVPCGGAGEYAGCQLLGNAQAAAAKIQALEQQLAGVTAAIARRDGYQADLKTADTALVDRRHSIKTLEAKRASHQKLAEYATPLAQSDTRIAELKGQLAALVQTHAATLETTTARHTARRAELEAEQMQLTASLERLQRDFDAAKAELDAATTGHTQADQRQRALTQARGEMDRLAQTLGEVASSRTQLAARREDLQQKQARRRDLLRRREQVRNELVEWGFFAKAFGKGGLPDLEIDAAGPTITADTNALLLECYGPRFTIELVTQVEKVGGGMKDEFTVRVLDNEDVGGGWRDISELSGGQKVVVQEALMCALCIYVNERSDRPIRTLFRDETGAALDPENAVRYVEMLRAVQRRGGFHHVIFVSHNEDIYNRADTQIRVGDGRAAIAWPPFSQEAT